MKSIIKLFSWLTIVIFMIIGCINSSSNYISQEDFIRKNQAIDYEKWKNWEIMLREGAYYYIAYFKPHLQVVNDSIDIRKRFIFWYKDSIYVRLTLPDTVSNAISIKYLLSNKLWRENYQDINLDDLKSHIDFIFKYKMEHVIFDTNPDHIFFKTDSIDLVYLFTPQDSGFKTYKYKITPNWYSRTCSQKLL